MTSSQIGSRTGSQVHSQVPRNQFGLTERDMATLYAILSRYPDIRQVCIFGSRAKGTYKQGSDIDLAVINFGVDEEHIRRLQADCIESSLPYFIDVLYLPSLTDIAVKDHILRVGVLFYEAPVEQF
jgi:predicted nucleotidyltransferase